MPTGLTVGIQLGYVSNGRDYPILHGQHRLDKCRKPTGCSTVANTRFEPADLYRLNFLGAFCIHGLRDGVDPEMVANRNPRAMTFEVSRQTRIQVATALIRMADNLYLTFQVGVRNPDVGKLVVGIHR